VVEVKYDGVAVAAVDTRMRPQIRHHRRPIRGARSFNAVAKAQQLGAVVLVIAGGVDLGEALPTPRLQDRLSAPLRRERIRRLPLPAPSARKQLRRTGETSGLPLPRVQSPVPLVLVLPPAVLALRLAPTGVGTNVELGDRLRLAARPAGLGLDGGQLHPHPPMR
jgi:hypothetical protein